MYRTLFYADLFKRKTSSVKRRAGFRRRFGKGAPSCSDRNWGVVVKYVERMEIRWERLLRVTSSRFCLLGTVILLVLVLLAGCRAAAAPSRRSLAAAGAMQPTRDVPLAPAPTLPPAVIPPAGGTTASVQVRESTVTFQTYPYEAFWQDKRDPATNIAFHALDRAAYDAGMRAFGVQPKTFRAVILENEYLALTFLPDLGGRLFQITYKPTRQTLLYNNAVLKPSPWGMAEQGGWLAAGGIEWAFPTREHGYEWNAPWSFEIVQDANGASIILRDSNASDRPRVQVTVTLPANAAYLAIAPRVENPTTTPQRLQFWLNAQLAPGAHGKVSPNTEFLFPTDSVVVHSTGDASIDPQSVPSLKETAPRAPVSLSNLGGRDLRWFRNWDNYLGVFAADAKLAQNFVGAYNHTEDVGVARVFPPDAAPGVKLFAFGPNFCCRDQYTDDGSQYFELWGGLPRTFFADDDVMLGAGETRGWTEYWLPLAQMGGLKNAARDAALNVTTDGATARLVAYSAIARAVVLVLKQNGQEIKRWNETLTPGRVWQAQVAAAGGAVQFEMLAPSGAPIIIARQ